MSSASGRAYFATAAVVLSTQIGASRAEDSPAPLTVQVGDVTVPGEDDDRGATSRPVMDAQKKPKSIVVVDQKTIEDQNLNRLDELQQFVPSLVVQPVRKSSVVLGNVVAPVRPPNGERTTTSLSRRRREISSTTRAKLLSGEFGGRVIPAAELGALSLTERGRISILRLRHHELQCCRVKPFALLWRSNRAYAHCC
ncbi:hypothetical protein [Methylosinus sp. PW1]|uniref:hypothetical protein n=1 Tax=Methylosinus sp. PW1 TaxID=107636 RepID=UPI0018DCF857|nr:hypothetical protein [Methylosinus sp. PW1]